MIEFIKIIKDVLGVFEKRDLAYVITRNYDFLLKNKVYEGKDIDICIEKKDLKDTERLFKEKGFKKFPINPFSNHVGYVKFVVSSKKLLFFHIHIGGITGANLRYLDSSHILSHRKKMKFFYVPNYEDEFLIILLHCLLDKRSFREDYKRSLVQLSKRKLDMDYIKEILNTRIGEKNTNQVLKQINKESFQSLKKGRLTDIYSYFMKNYSYKTLRLLRLYGLGGIWKLLWMLKSKPLISFIGMDGAGKTTTSNNLLKVLKENNLTCSRIYTGRGRNNILPIQFFGEKYTKMGGKGSLGKEGKGRDKFKLIHTLAAPVFSFDLWLRYVFRILPLRKTKHFVITDRYTTDVLLMNKVPMFLKRFLFIFFPKPTITFYIYNTPEKLSQRKNHPIDDLYRQKLIFKKINRLVNPIKIKSDSPKNTLDTVLFHVFK